ncbi:hypothetical protein MTR67_025675 [Solanum verrucosum]|uniref:Pentatricopeptide repeat-containing protein n=1 Tax=Solanum verrucosum TaxID=315347 RepID=A0AAF0TYX0_SOLVR|nr:hypothetical protein MTR67_025675 [Solanum verrucosum]
MIDKKIEPDIISYSVLINGYCKEKPLAEAMQLFHEISQNGSKPDIFTYNILLQGLFEAGKIDSAKKIFAEMLSTVLVPDLYTLCTLLNGYFKYGLVEEAMSFFNKLERKIEYTSIEFYNVVINGLCKNSELDKARVIFEKLSLIGMLPNKMEDNGCMPNNVNEMATYMKEMVRKGFSCDADTTELLVNVIRENPSVLDMIPEFRSEHKK